MSFPDLLDSLMKTYRVTNMQLAEAIGVSDTAVKKWRKGAASPSLDNVDKIAEYFDKSLDELSGNKSYKKNSERHNIPVIGRIQAGYPVESYENIEGYVSLPAGVPYSEDLFALTVVGDSMMPLVMDGDIIICNKNARNINNKICAVTVDGESTLKRVRFDSTSVTLIPTNPMYNEIKFSSKKAEEKGFRVDGVLVQMIRNF